MRRINLITRSVSKKQAEWRTLPKNRIWFGVISVFVIMGLVFLGQSLWIMSLRIRIPRQQKAIQNDEANLIEQQSAVTKAEEQRKRIRENSKRLEGKLRVIRMSRSRQIDFSEVLKTLSEYVPSDLWIDKMMLDQNQITIIGTTLDNIKVSQFMERLDTSVTFERTGFNYTEKTDLDGRPLINFEVTTHILMSTGAL
ncbi:PilN domain-containing protein [PVC group bacterium]|nr:PilN domain-containing protein [PVC group bacterium]